MSARFISVQGSTPSGLTQRLNQPGITASYRVVSTGFGGDPQNLTYYAILEHVPNRDATADFTNGLRFPQ